MFCKPMMGVLALAAGLLGVAGATPAQEQWMDRTPGPPPPTPRVMHAMAYDSTRQRTVLFGGWDGATNGETWEWNGSVWSLAHAGDPNGITAPIPRVQHAMAYDRARGVTVLFGGGPWAPAYNDTWVWDGTTWTDVSTTGPSVRSQHAMAYDSAREVTVLFGGISGGYDGETWEWDGTTWTHVASTGPSPRDSHALAYDSARGVTVLFGGHTQSDDTWEWDGITWTDVSTNGPSGRSEHAVAYDIARGVAVLFGGISGGYDGETWEWDGTTWTQVASTGPSPRYDHTMVYDSARRVTVLFGGGNSIGSNGETWEYGTDCNTNGIPDADDITSGTSSDCNSNTVPDECDISAGTSSDCNTNGVPDECELPGNDCNTNEIPDDCDIGAGTSDDCQPDGVPDECQVTLHLPWTDPEPLNNNAATDSGNDQYPQVTTDGAGNWVAVWKSNDDLGGTIGPDFDILVARSSDNGTTWTDPEALDNNAATDSGDDRDPQVTTDGAGHWVAVWPSTDSLDGAVGTDYDILVARITTADLLAGLPWTDPEPLNNNAATDSETDSSPQVTTGGAGNWVAVWESSEDLGGTIGTDWDILVTRSSDNGLTWTDPQPLNNNAATDSGGDHSPQVTTDGAGNWAAVWRSYDDLGGTIGTDEDILVARITTADLLGGLPWTDPEPLNNNAATDSGHDMYPQVTTDGAGNWAAVWHSNDTLDGTIGTDEDILAARITTPDLLAGLPWTDPSPLNNNAATDSGNDESPQVTTDGAGNWVAVWESWDSLGGTIGNDFDILLARVEGAPPAPDCNTNGIPDECDIAAGTSHDCNTNGVPDECEMITPGDFDADGDVDLDDHAGFVAYMAGPGQALSASPECLDTVRVAFDFDDDDDIDLSDFAGFQEAFTGGPGQ